SVARRRRSLFDARRTGFSPSFSRRARTNLSIGVLDHFGSFGCGTGTVFRGWKDQKFLLSAEITYFPSGARAVVTADLGHTAPALTQAARSAISESFSLPPMGILSSASVWRTA